MLRALADNASRRGRATLAITAVFFAVAVGFGAPVFGLLETSGNPFVDPDSETERVRERLEQAAGERAGVGLIAVVDAQASIESAAARGRVEPVARTLEDVPAVARVFSFYETGDPAQVSRGRRSTYLAAVTSEIVFIKELGIGTALAVIIDATIIRALLVPALMALLGSRNWWAPASLRRLHHRIGLSERGSAG